MGQRVLSTQERIEIYTARLAGQTLKEIAQEKAISYETVRKWWRVGRDKGLQGVTNRACGRPACGNGSTFEEGVLSEALALKRKHHRWGACRILVELAQDERFSGIKLSSSSRLHVVLKEQCPECIGNWTHHIKMPHPPKARAVHEVWQLDHQEGIPLADGSRATVCNLRDPYGAAMIARMPFEVRTAKRWRKLT